MQLMPSAPRCPVLFKTPTLDGSDGYVMRQTALDMPQLMSHSHTNIPNQKLISKNIENIQRKARQGNCVAPASAGRNSELAGIQVKGSRDTIVILSLIIFFSLSLSFLCRKTFFSIIIQWPIPMVCVKEGWEHGAQEE